MAYNSKKHDVSYDGISAKVHAVNRASALIQLESIVKRFGKPLLLDPEAASYMERDYSVSVIREIESD